MAPTPPACPSPIAIFILGHKDRDLWQSYDSNSDDSASSEDRPCCQFSILSSNDDIIFDSFSLDDAIHDFSFNEDSLTDVVSSLHRDWELDDGTSDSLTDVD
jgi:hypothetical protein